MVNFKSSFSFDDSKLKKTPTESKDTKWAEGSSINRINA